MKRKFTLLLALALIPLMQTSAFADKDISIIVNGEKVQLDQPPIIEDGRTLVPFRAVLEKMGASVNWDNATQTVTCTLEDKEVSLVINSDKMQTSEGEIILDVPAKIVNSRTMVPIRAISEGLGAEVEWNDSDRSVSISSSLPEQYDGYSIVSTADGITYGDLTIPINAKYPVLVGDSPAIAAINSAVEADVKDNIASCKAEYADFITDIGDVSANWNIDITYEIKTLDENIVSMSVTDYSFLGGAHPNTTVHGITYSLDTGEKLIADDFITDALTAGKDGVRLMVQADPEQYPFYDEEQFSLTDNDFYIEDNKLVFLVQAYEIAPYARGLVEYKIDLNGLG
jgi:hypothetical protein